MPGLPVTIRTLDVGGEKVLSYLDEAQEPNPELGLRSIRFTLQNRVVFETQIRAILRAAEGSSLVRIMFPMISSLDQFIDAKQVVSDCDDQAVLRHFSGAMTAMEDFSGYLPVIPE